METRETLRPLHCAEPNRTTSVHETLYQSRYTDGKALAIIINPNKREGKATFFSTKAQISLQCPHASRRSSYIILLRQHCIIGGLYSKIKAVVRVSACARRYPMDEHFAVTRYAMGLRRLTTSRRRMARGFSRRGAFVPKLKSDVCHATHHITNVCRLIEFTRPA
jgi:hypothetical protein